MAEVTSSATTRSWWVQTWLFAAAVNTIFALVAVIGAAFLDRPALDARITDFTASLALYVALEARWPKPKGIDQ